MNGYKRLTLTILALALSIPSASQAGTASFVTLTDEHGEIVGALETAGAAVSDFHAENHLVPRGSAALTRAGALENQGIRYIVHAASGGMTVKEGEAAPSLEGVTASIVNSIRVAERFGVKRLAIPLVGGGIFLNSLGISKDRLAEKIIETAWVAKPQLEVAFVVYGAEETAVMQKAYKKVRKSHDGFIARVKTAFKNKAFPARDAFFQRSRVVSGSITDFAVHGADAIVNAANMELQFGGGLSGVIGRATGDESAIDNVGRELIQKLLDARGEDEK